MNEWKELKIDNLPPDILTGDYEFGIKNDYINKNYLIGDIIPSTYQDSMTILMRVYQKTDIYYYRKPELKQPSHKEIISKWWNGNTRNGETWQKVEGYSSDKNKGGSKYWIYASYKYKEWFLEHKSADIPPEA